MLSFTVKATSDSTEYVIGKVDEMLEENDCPMKVQMQIDVAVDEIFSNIALYAYPNTSGEATIVLDFNSSNNVFTMQFSDQGVPYNPLQHEEPDVTLSANEREIGGLGIFIVKKTMDDVSYNYENESNILTITKKLF